MPTDGWGEAAALIVGRPSNVASYVAGMDAAPFLNLWWRLNCADCASTEILGMTGRLASLRAFPSLMRRAGKKSHLFCSLVLNSFPYYFFSKFFGNVSDLFEFLARCTCNTLGLLPLYLFTSSFTSFRKGGRHVLRGDVRSTYST